MRKTAVFILLVISSLRVSAAPYGAGFYDTSEYLMGKVAVNVIFVQSDNTLTPFQPRTEVNGWTLAKKSDVMTGVQSAMDWWAVRNSSANLSFVYNNITVNTGYEPINCNIDPSNLPATPACPKGEEDWIAQVMGTLGYAEPDYGDRVYHYDNDRRTATGSDWSLTIFMVDSEADPDGQFVDGYFAYAYVGGPFMVMTYDNEYYGIGQLAPVAAHETGHIFHALDEYAASNCTTVQKAGYLSGPNSNCENGGSPLVPCIMRGGVAPYNTPAFCQHTARMLGWVDTDADGILDINDLPPVTELTAFMPDPTTNTSPVYYGLARATAAYTNINTYAYSVERTTANISINRIASVEYKVDGGAWQAAAARDGAFDQNVDSFTFTAALLATGSHTLYARARDIFGAYDATPASDLLDVDPGQAQDIPSVNDGTGADADYTRSRYSVSANWGASSHSSGINHYEYAVGTAPGDSSTVAWTPVGVLLSTTTAVAPLAEGTDYYFSVKAYPNSGSASGASSSDGFRVDNTSPTAGVLITSPVPVKTGVFSARLRLAETNGLAGNPQLSFTGSDGVSVPLVLSYLADSTWTASGYIESYSSTGTASFHFTAADLAGNSGASITSGATFTIDTAVSGVSGGSLSNSDGNAVTLPAGAFAGDLFVSISTVPEGAVSAADAASPESKRVFSSDLVRSFTAMDGAWAPVTSFSAPLTITMPYPDANDDGRIDMDLMKESAAWIYYLDPSAGRWTPVPGVVRNAAANTLSAEVSHFSVYSVRAAGSAASDIRSLRAYPNPCDFRASSYLTVDGLPPDAEGARLFIYNEAGELVRSLARGDGIDSLNVISWDGRLKDGAKAASGLYIYLLKTLNYGKGTGKFFIVW